MSHPQRYQRQEVLPQVGASGQARLRGARVLVVGCGALGSTIAEQVVRAGVGFVRLVDRDLVEWTNLQRQVMFDENDARQAVPKAAAAGQRLERINSDVVLDPVVMDIDSTNIESLLDVPGEGTGNAGASPDAPARQRVDLILDGTDNAEIRYLINDVAVRHGIPWVYGGVVGTEGRVMPIWPGCGPCLRCLFETPPAPGELPTCDVAGVLGPAASVVASLQAAVGLRLLIEGAGALDFGMLALDVWTGRMHRIGIADAQRDDCPCCSHGRFDFLNAPRAGGSATLCGRDAVQVRPADPRTRLDLDALARRLQPEGRAPAGRIQRDRFFLRLYPADAPETLTIFPDARVIVSGTRDPARARTLVARWVGG